MPDVERVRTLCKQRLERLAADRRPAARDVEVYRLGEAEGWRTCLRVLANVPPGYTPAQAVYVRAGFHADFSTRPTHRSLYDAERGFMDDRESASWTLAWNRVISRVQGWLEAEYGLAEYEDTKDLPRPPLPLIDWDAPEKKRDLEASVKAMLKGAPRRPRGG